MPLSSNQGPGSAGRLVKISGICALLGLGTLGAFYLAELIRLGIRPSTYITPGPGPSDRLARHFEGLRQPETHRAQDAKLDDADEVMGVVVNGKARAYRLKTMMNPQEHVINDLV